MSSVHSLARSSKAKLKQKVKKKIQQKDPFDVPKGDKWDLCDFCSKPPSKPPQFNIYEWPFTTSTTSASLHGPNCDIHVRNIDVTVNPPDIEASIRTLVWRQKVRRTRLYRTASEIKRQREKDYRITLKHALEEEKLQRKLGAQRLRDRKKKLVNDIGPRWYQELSYKQMASMDLLGKAIVADLEEGIVSRTRKLLASLGILPRPKYRDVLKAALKCCYNPIIFLAYLYKYTTEMEGKCLKSGYKYSINDRLLLSSLAYLALPRTICDLWWRFPPEFKPPSEKPGTAMCSVKRKKYTSPYLEPHPLLVSKAIEKAKRTQALKRSTPTQEEPNEPDLKSEDDEEMIDFSELSELMRLHTSPVLRGTSGGSDLIPQRDRKSLYFHRRQEEDDKNIENDIDVHNSTSEEEEKMQTKEEKAVMFDKPPIPIIVITLAPDEPEDDEDDYPYKYDENYEYQRDKPVEVKINDADDASLGFDSTSERDMPKEMESQQSVCNCERATYAKLHPPSTEIPVVSPKSSIRSLISLNESPSDQLPSPIPTEPSIRAALLNYWEGYDIRTDKSEEKEEGKPLKTELRNISQQTKDMLDIMGKEGNVLAALPDVHKLPQIRQWILYRKGFQLTPKAKGKLMNKSISICAELQEHPRVIPPLTLRLKNISKLNWHYKHWLKDKVNNVSQRYYRNIRQAQVNDVREYWGGMYNEYFFNPEFRNVYFAYLASKEEDVFPVNPWIPTI